MTVGRYYCQSFLSVFCSVITYLTVWGTCQAFFFTEETDNDAVICRTSHVSFESAMPARCIKCHTGVAKSCCCLVLCKLTKAENWWAFSAGLWRLLCVKWTGVCMCGWSCISMMLKFLKFKMQWVKCIQSYFTQNDHNIPVSVLSLKGFALKINEAVIICCAFRLKTALG